MEIRECISFKGSWRSYQRRVLDSADRYLQDGKIHIVAAPGSGKTTLGIELIGRLNSPTLILVPTITIREQWANRIREAFLVDGVEADIISTDLKKPSLITIATYQALHCSRIKYAGELTEAESEETDDELQKETVDFSKFDLLKEMKKIGLGTICLDECHHLRSEWQKSLDEFVQEIKNKRIIALTATPPYDSTPALWAKYMDLCGEIDAEITIPELVKEGTLCPHQDYVYFNYPTGEEMKILDEFEDKCEAFTEKLMQDQQLQAAVSSHAFLREEVDLDEVLETPEYLSSILIYMNEKQLNYPKKYLKILGAKNLPKMEAKWMEILLQNFLYADPERFYCDNTYRESLAQELKREGLVEKRKVTLSRNAAIEKLLVSSKGKSDSILEIAKSEYQSMGPSLRMLILTDYIRREFEKDLGTDTPILQLGVLPFFENLRRCESLSGVKLGVLCGSVVIIPADAMQALEGLMEGAAVSYTQVGQISGDEYVKVSVSGKSHLLTTAVTELFSRGFVQILIGTKSLLGEGWDSPCVNSLILASFVGSYMLSNQMRGRAIRVWDKDRRKTSNIWHLVCLNPRKHNSQEISQDLIMLERRMDHFCGLHYKENTIESGMKRLDLDTGKLNKSNVSQLNQRSIEMSQRRDVLLDRWLSALEISNKIEVVQEAEVENAKIPVVLLTDVIRLFILGVVVMAIQGALMTQGAAASIAGMIARIVLLVLAILIFKKLPGIIALSSPLRILKRYGRAVRKTLEELNMLEDPRSKVEVEEVYALSNAVYLLGGTSRDKTVFTDCMSDLFSPIDNQRYILYRKRYLPLKKEYFTVPDAFSKNKEAAQCFQKNIEKYIGKFELIYTRNAEGRKLLLEGRAKAYANRQTRFEKRERVKGALL